MSPAIGATGKLPRSARVRRHREFTRIQGRGIRFYTDSFTIIASPGDPGRTPRLGCAISRRVGPAVIRNRLRRLLKEVFRRQAATLPVVDLVIVAKPKARDLASGGLDAVAKEIVPAVALIAARAVSRPGEGSERPNSDRDRGHR